MKRFTTTAVMLGLLGAHFAPGAHADERNKETHLTINVPLRVQDTLLAPGEYVFKLVELAANSTVVSIFNSKGTNETSHVSRTNGKGQNAGKPDAAAPAGN